jgi:hypothetical protein
MSQAAYYIGYAAGILTIPAIKLLWLIVYLIRVGVHDARYHRNPIKGFCKSVKTTFQEYLYGCTRVL